MEPIVTFWGAIRSVTGSLHRVDACGQSLLLDCGLMHGSRAESLHRNRAFPFRPRDIDAVLLSHAHVDHCGNLPNLVRQGFAGPIYCTPATRALAAVMPVAGRAARDAGCAPAVHVNRGTRPPGSPGGPLTGGTAAGQRYL